jgi:hypothetical protein
MFERGATLKDATGEVVVTFAFPTIGVPNIATGEPASASVFDAAAVTFRIGGWQLDAFFVALRAAFGDRLALLPTGKPPVPVPVTLSVPIVVAPALSGVQATHGVSASAALQERQLYDIAVRGDDGVWHAVAPHAVYYRAAWHDFGVAHITDTHVARRIDYFAGRLEAAGRPESARKMVNFNDRFRGFIRYANYLHGIGVLDVILATGDIIDYLFEDDDEQSAGGNALFARNLLLGLAPSARFPEAEELRVPMFIVAGNHDYRMYPYRLVFDLDFGPANVQQLSNFATYRIDKADALVADNRQSVSTLSAETAARSVQIDRDHPSFTAHLADKPNYVVRLGSHRIVMLDSGSDTGLPQSKLDLVIYALGGLPEDKRTSVGGSPNSVGVTNEMLKLVVDTLAETPDEGLFIVGLHAPLFNMWDEEYPYFLRETQRRAQAAQVHGWLARHDSGSRAAQIGEAVRQQHPAWFGTSGDPDAVAYVKRGDPDEFLDFGVSRGASHEVLKAIAGVGQRRRADIVLHGHIHRYNEFRIAAQENGELAYYMDFYTQNFAHYYQAAFVAGWRQGPDGRPLPDVESTYVDIATDAPANNQPSRMPIDTKTKYMVTVPPYPEPLTSARDPRAWWAEHRPLVVQTEALGPFKNADANLGGFRVLSVKNDVIERVHFASIETLDAHDYQVDWQKVITPDPLRAFVHSQRSKEFGGPEAAGDPCGYVLPSDGIQNIVYRDTQNRLIELWRDAAGRRGNGNVTEVASAPTAGGDPSCYLDTTSGKVIVPHRGADGHVHSLYWATGAVGHDALSKSVNAPGTVGTPVGYYNPATTNHHVAYRSADDHLQVLWWKGNEAVGRGVLTEAPGAVKAAGDPAPYLDTKRGTNVVVYRGTDGHIRSYYWADGPIGTDDLSGFAQSPRAESDPVAMYIAAKDTHLVVYRSGNGHLHELYWLGEAPVAAGNLTAASGAPAAEGDPAMWYNTNADKIHVLYRGTDGHIHDLSWTPGGGAPAHVDLSHASYAPPAAGAPFGFSGPTHQHVVYRGTDKQIHEIRWIEQGPILGNFATLLEAVFVVQPSS